MLTQRQADLLRFIVAYQRATDGVSPSFREMAQHMGTASHGYIHGIAVQLEERGYIRRLRRREAAIEVLRHPPAMRSAVALAFRDDGSVERMFVNAGAGWAPISGRV